MRTARYHILTAQDIINGEFMKEHKKLSRHLNLKRFFL